MVDTILDEYGNNIANDHRSISFNCPKCGKGKIVRTGDAKRNGVKYTCPDCGFVGP